MPAVRNKFTIFHNSRSHCVGATIGFNSRSSGTEAAPPAAPERRSWNPTEARMHQLNDAAGSLSASMWDTMNFDDYGLQRAG